jgi:hypothetical protein
MVFTIESGRSKVCKNSLGGVSKLWLFPFVNYSRSQIITNENILVTFPNTQIYRFNFLGNPSIGNNQSENEGGKFHELDLSFSLQGSQQSTNIEKLLYKDYRAIYQDRNGNFVILGLYNGLECTNLTYNTGGGKSELNGFNLAFNGQEEKDVFFINSLEDAGFFDADFEYRITQDGQFRITQNNNFRVIE